VNTYQQNYKILECSPRKNKHNFLNDTYIKIYGHKSVHHEKEGK
jgi:hypothetical protein